jgi:hypothetical protein
MIKKVISLVVFLIVANAGYHWSMAWFHSEQFKDAVKEIALFGAGKSDDALKKSVMDAADDNQVPLDPDDIQIARRSSVGVGDHIVISYSYSQMVELFPRRPRQFDFEYTTP